MSLGAGVVWGRWALDGHRHDLLAAEEDEAEGPAVLALLVGFGGGIRVRVRGFLRRGQLSKLLAVAEDEVHVAVEGHELPDELAAVLDRDAHAVVDVLEHLGSLRHRHFR